MTQQAFDDIKQVAVIITDGNEVDLICDYDYNAVDHIKDLRGMGCEVRVKLFPNWPQAETYADKLQGVSS